MKCSKAKKLISSHIDGDLDAGKSSSLEKHLEACPDCQKLLKDFQTITNQAKDLEQEPPSAQVWFRIQARVKEAKQKRVSPEWGRRERVLLLPAKIRYAVSAAFLLLVIVGAVIISLRIGNQAGILSGRNGEKYALAKLEEAERHYQLAIKALWEAVQAQKESFDPKIAEIFRTNLEVIDASIAECRKAMEVDPNDLESRYYLLAMYKKKADFLDDIIEVASTSSQRKESNKVI